MCQVSFKQNQEDMLRVQYAARYSFNRAEKFSDYVWWLCILAAIAAFLPDSVSEELKLVIPAAIDLLAAFCGRRLSIHLAAGALFRKYFDAYVLGIGFEEFDRDSKQKILERVLKIERNNLQEAKVQMSNTSRDDPPGVKDWYELPDSILPEDEIYECQRQNCWWNDRLAKLRLRWSLVLCIAVVVLSITMLRLLDIEIFRLILCCIGLVIYFIQRIWTNFRYLFLSVEIDGIVQNLSTARTEDNVHQLQKLIDERRAMPVLERNRIHKKRAKKFSEEAEKINKIT